MATRPPAETAWSRGCRQKEREVEGCTIFSESSSEAEYGSTAISVDQVSGMESIRERPRGTHRRHSGDGLRYHPKTEPYKLMLNPPECIRMKNWEDGFFYTYNGYAKAPKDNFEPMHVASGIKFHPADAADIVVAASYSPNRPHEPSRIISPSRRWYTTWICRLRYFGEAEGEANYILALEERIKALLEMLEKEDGEKEWRRSESTDGPSRRPAATALYLI